MVRIQARLEEQQAVDRRGSPRRKLSLGLNLQKSGDGVLVHDFSSNGMLIESVKKLALFDGIEVDLPEAGPTYAIIVWNSGHYYGCEFREPLSKAAVSAALLRSRPNPSATPAKAHSLVAVDSGDEFEPLAVQEPPQFDEEKAPLTTRLRVILGSAILLWAIIIASLWSLIRLIR